MSDFLTRMMDEQTELNYRIGKLTTILTSDVRDFHNEEVRLMDIQLHYMRAYSNTLADRIEFERKIRLK